MVVPFRIVRTQSKSRWGIPCRRVLKGLTLRCMTSKENNYSFSHAPCLSPFKLSLSDHLLKWNGINVTPSALSVLFIPSGIFPFPFPFPFPFTFPFPKKSPNRYKTASICKLSQLITKIIIIMLSA